MYVVRIAMFAVRGTGKKSHVYITKRVNYMTIKLGKQDLIAATPHDLAVGYGKGIRTNDEHDAYLKYAGEPDCERCATQETLNFVACPREEFMEGDDTPMWLCDACLDEAEEYIKPLTKRYP